MKKAFVYCRKSSESEERQALSIEAQLDETKKIVQRFNFKVVETYTESQSAKAPGRPKFTEMMSRVMNGEVDVIVCWKLNRLARNPIDGGSVIWATKSCGIEIITPSNTYNHESMLLTYFEFGMAQKFIDDLSKDSKRGMRKKAEKGWYPAPAPLGYQNTPDRKKGFKIIIKDNNFELVKRCFHEVINGKQPVRVWEMAANEWGVTAKNGKPIARSTFYRLLTNPFYYGEFEWPSNSGNWYKGKHEAMITNEEYDIIQKHLGNKGRPIARSHTFDLTGLFRCSICGCAITATKKVKRYKTTGRTAEYIYYHCSKKSKEIKCTQKPITEADLEAEIMKQLLMLRPPEEFVQWAKKWIGIVHRYESDTQEEILAARHKDLERVENKLNSLLDMRLNDDITDETYQEKKKELKKQKHKIKMGLENVDEKLSSWRVRVERAIDVAYGAYLKFKTGDRDERHEVMLSIGSNLLLDHKKIRIELADHFQEFSEQEKWAEKYEDWVEPQKYTDLFNQFPDLRPANPIWLPDVDSNHEP